jgi:hypothetical protein
MVNIRFSLVICKYEMEVRNISNRESNIPNLLPVADIDIFLKLRLGAEVAIHILSNKDGLESCKAENHPGSQEAVYNCRANLGFYELAYPSILKRGL